MQLLRSEIHPSKLPCNENGLLNDDDAKSNISVNLIKANRTKITDSNVYGVSYGYDVYAGGAGNDKDGSKDDGRSGGFVGFNDEGLLKNNNMYYCDVVRGTKNLVGPLAERVSWILYMELSHRRRWKARITTTVFTESWMWR